MTHKKEVFYTGQKVTWHSHMDSTNGTLKCPVCGKTIGLNDGQKDGATGLAWADDVIGKYVCRKCLTVPR